MEVAYGKKQKSEAVSYTHLDVYKRQVKASAALMDALSERLSKEDYALVEDCLLYTSSSRRVM